VIDPATRVGLAQQRTALAWRRTALAFAGNGILLARSPDVAIVIAAFCVLGVAAGIAATSSTAFRNPETHGWIVTHQRRGDVLLMLITAFISLLDIIAVVRW